MPHPYFDEVHKDFSVDLVVNGAGMGAHDPFFFLGSSMWVIFAPQKYHY